MLLEGRIATLETLSLLGMIAGGIIAGLAILVGALRSRRFVPLVVVLLGGVAGVVPSWWVANWWSWPLAVFLSPVGMWLGWLGGASRSRTAVGAAVGGTVGAAQAALAFPTLLRTGGYPDNAFWALSGLPLGGCVGILLRGSVGWLRNEQSQCR